MNHKDLDAWKQAMSSVEAVYRATARFPKDETYGLVAQMRRAAVSVPSNISEGAGRNSKRELIQYLSIALGSLAELETQAMIAERLNYHVDSDLVAQVNRVRAIVIGLRNSLESPAGGMATNEPSNA